MNLSKSEPRVLHALAPGGCIRHRRAAGGATALAVDGGARCGGRLVGRTAALFNTPRRRGLIGSRDRQPCRIGPPGRLNVRPQPDNHR